MEVERLVATTVGAFSFDLKLLRAKFLRRERKWIGTMEGFLDSKKLKDYFFEKELVKIGAKLMLEVMGNLVPFLGPFVDYLEVSRLPILLIKMHLASARPLEVQVSSSQ